MRELVGYLRFDSPGELKVLNDIWELDQVYTNYLLAQQKLTSEQRKGAKVTKRHDRAQSPYQRTLAWEELAVQDRAKLELTMAQIKPAELYRQIAVLTARLENMALSKAPAPVRPAVNRAFNAGPKAEVPHEATNQPWRRI